MRNERGQVLPVAAVVMVVAVLGAAAVGRLGARAVRRAQASSAAEAAALAAAVLTPSGNDPTVDHATEVRVASAAASANHASLEEVVDEPGGRVVRVTVVVDGERARARASRAGSRLDAGLRAALARAGQVVGHAVAVIRIDADGLAVQVADGDVAALVGLGSGGGICPVVGRPAWFEVCDPPEPGTMKERSQQPVRSPPGTEPVGGAPESEPGEE